MYSIYQHHAQNVATTQRLVTASALAAATAAATAPFQAKATAAVSATVKKNSSRKINDLHENATIGLHANADNVPSAQVRKRFVVDRSDFTIIEYQMLT